ncbi:8823_t:CDS:2 [Diversispora eburnea]|uniref:8823_t:CDS:1 n=1 Tax=Diversispora eburnea TaxID=1213867 RepID=A0A9N8Z2I4_9GLOM|nr:8823_t:CDS:2 [Diversispora eburnea]
MSQQQQNQENTSSIKDNAAYYAGAAKEFAGKTVGSDQLSKEGEKQKLEAQQQMESKKLEQRTEGKAEGMKDRVSGGIQETAGTVMGDENLKNKGATERSKGQAQTEEHK